MRWWGGSCISCAICKSFAPCSRLIQLCQNLIIQFFYRADALPEAKAIASKHQSFELRSCDQANYQLLLWWDDFKDVWNGQDDVDWINVVQWWWQKELEMCGNAQRDGRPAEYRWRPLFNAAVWLTPTTRVPCSNVAKTWNPLKLPGVPQTNERISAASEPKFTILWGHVGGILLLNKFFPIVDTCLSCKPDKVAGWCLDGDFWRLFWVLHLQWAACSTFQTCILNSHKGHTMCRSMVDIQSVAAEIKRGKKEDRKKLQGKNIMAPLLHRAAIIRHEGWPRKTWWDGVKQCVKSFGLS